MFVFFGLVAVLGTAYVQIERITWLSVAVGIGVGALACAILVANNLRDIPTDTESDKRTLAVLLGDKRTRGFYVLLIVIAVGSMTWAATFTPWALLAILGLPFLARANRVVASGAKGLALIPVLRDTGLAELVYAGGLALGLALGA